MVEGQGFGVKEKKKKEIRDKERKTRERWKKLVGWRGGRNGGKSRVWGKGAKEKCGKRERKTRQRWKQWGEEEMVEGKCMRVQG
jgi:hypothetical protein